MDTRNDISSVLSEIRNLRSQMKQPVKIDPEVRPNELQPTQRTEKTPSFGDMMTKAIDQVNDLQKTSGALTTAYQAGDPTADLTQVMIASQKSSVAFTAMTQVRNRVVKAYEDILNMPI